MAAGQRPARRTDGTIILYKVHRGESETRQFAHSPAPTGFLQNGYVVTVDYGALIKMQQSKTLPNRVNAMGTTKVFDEYLQVRAPSQPPRSSHPPPRPLGASQPSLPRASMPYACGSTCLARLGV